MGADTRQLDAAQKATAEQLSALSARIDEQFGSTHGSLLHRFETAWDILPPGTSGQFLKTLGAGADAAWATIAGGVTVIVPPTNLPAATTATITNIPQIYSELMFVVRGGSSASASSFFDIQVDNDAAAGSLDTTAGNYHILRYVDGAVTSRAGLAYEVSTTAAVTRNIVVSIKNYIAGPAIVDFFVSTSAPAGVGGGGIYLGVVPIQALVMTSSVGNYDAGTYALYGII